VDINGLSDTFLVVDACLDVKDGAPECFIGAATSLKVRKQNLFVDDLHETDLRFITDFVIFVVASKRGTVGSIRVLAVAGCHHLCLRVGSGCVAKTTRLVLVFILGVVLWSEPNDCSLCVVLISFAFLLDSRIFFTFELLHQAIRFSLGTLRFLASALFIFGLVGATGSTLTGSVSRLCAVYLGLVSLICLQL